MTGKHPSRSGAALIIALGFLAILTVMIITFSALTRTERLAARTYLSGAQSRQLLYTALNRAMLDIDAAAGTNYPAFYALGSLGDGAERLPDTLDFALSETFLQTGSEALRTAYETERDAAEWETVTAPTTGEAVGRIGYVIVNTSGLLDANAVGGTRTRSAGLSPQEIMLSAGLLPDFNSAGERIDPDTGAATPSDDALAAFVFNRENTWQRFESLRDLEMLNDPDRGDLILDPVASFSTFSHSLETNDYGRTFMGTNEATLNLDFIEEELEAVSAVEPEFVLNQLRDYLDTDTVPEDEDGDYSDYSVEPVPMINEIALTCAFTFVPNIESVSDGAGGTEEIVSFVTVSNTYTLELEVWYPFVGYTNSQAFVLSIVDPPAESGSVDPDLFGTVTDWTADMVIPAGEAHPDNRFNPYDLVAYTESLAVEAEDRNSLIDLFESFQSDIEFPIIRITDANGDKVDQTLGLEFPLAEAVESELMPEIEILGSNLFNVVTAVTTSNQFTVALASVDPRLNWDGTDLLQWKESYGLGTGIDSIGEVNAEELGSVTTDDPQDMLYVRNADRIDSPWEFTYFLYHSSNPWKTFQLLEAYDTDDTRAILRNLSPFPDGPPRSGRVSPFTPHTNVAASVFLDMPVDDFMGSVRSRMDADQARQAAAFFMEQVAKNGWTADAAACTENITVADLQNAMNGETNPWILESFFRNSRELFNPDDTLYTILAAAQSGIDRNEDGLISSNEIRSTDQAILYVWRDRSSGKAAIVFFGLTDTLQSTIAGGESWGTILDAFRP